MKKKRILSWILSMALVLSVFNIPLAGVYATTEEGSTETETTITGLRITDWNEEVRDEENPWEPWFYNPEDGESRYNSVTLQKVVGGTATAFEDTDFASGVITWTSSETKVADVKSINNGQEAEITAYPVVGTAVITATYDPDGAGSDEAVSVSFEVIPEVDEYVTETVFTGGVYYDIEKDVEDGVMTYTSVYVVGVAAGWNGAIADSVKDSAGVSHPVKGIESLNTRIYVTPAENEKRYYSEDLNDKFFYTDRTSVKTITIPASMTSLSVSDFYYVKGLTAVNVASANKDYYSVDGVVFEKYDKDDWYSEYYEDGKELYPDGKGVRPIKDVNSKYVLDAKGEVQYKAINTALIYYPRARTAKKYVIPDGVQGMDDSAFDGSGKTALKTIVLPASLDITQNTDWRNNKTEAYTFNGFQTTENGMFVAWNIKVLTKGDITALKAHANGYVNKDTNAPALPFGQYINKGSIKAGGLNMTVSTTDEGTIAINSIKKNNKKTVKVPAKVTINGVKYDVTTINAKAFKNCKKATKVVIPASVTLIKKNAFTGMKKLKTIEFKTKKNSITMKKGAYKGVKKSVVAKVPKKMKKAEMQKFQKAMKKAGFKGTVKK